MKILKIMLLNLCFACALFANFTSKDSIELQKSILKEFDIDVKFMKNSQYAFIKNSIHENKKKEFVKAVKEGYRHIPTLQKIIKDSGVPSSFLYLAMVESGFSNKVVSSKSAIGIWQFMPVTARNHGLRIDGYVDERLDPEASTIAATNYLKDLKKEFGKWYLAIMAYNCGAGKMRSAIRKAGTDDLGVLIDANKNYLPLETRNFIRKIIAASYISNDKNIAPLINKYTSGIELVKVEVPGGTTLMEVGDSIGLSLKRMRDYNSHLKFVYTPPLDDSYYLYIPKNKQDVFGDNFEALQDRKFEIYKVKKGETIFDIAQYAGIHHKVIKEYNNLASNDVKADQSIVIPSKKSVNYIAEYIVKSGDSLPEVSKKFDIGLKDIKDANALVSSNSPIGAKFATTK